MSSIYQKPSICFYIMNIIFLLYIVLVSKLCFSKPYYSGPGYNNDRDSESSAIASSHQKKRLLSDDSSQIQEASSLYDAPSRYRKYQPSADSPYMRRDARLDHDQSDFEVDAKERREYYDNSNAAAKDSSIEVILDPRAKKAVAVVENSPSGQAMYDLSGWKTDNQDNNEQVVNLVYPAERAGNDKRKYNSDGYETGKFADNYEGGNSDYSAPIASKAGMRDRLVDSNAQMTKKKRNVEMSKTQNNADNAKVDNTPAKRSIAAEKRKADGQLTKSGEKQNDCPPHNTPQNSDNKNLAKEVKRETEHWSQEQITALHNSLLKANIDNSEMSNLKAMLSEMGLLENTQKRNIDDNELQTDKEAIVEAKREIQTSEINDDDFNQDDDAMLNRNDRALSDDEKWEMDVNSAPQEPIEKRDAKDDKENMDKKRLNDNISNENPDSDSLALDISNTRQKRQNADKKVETNAKDIAKLGTDGENSETLKDNRFSKREAEEGTKKEKRKLMDDADYDKQMANQIQAKIDAIKEKVKRDILEDQKRDILEDQKRKRAKRFTNSDSNVEGTSDFKPSFRSRRNSNSENAEYDEKSSNSKPSSRKKRANMIQEKQMIYRPFQAEQDEETELDGNFDDNKLYLQKRQAADEDWQYFDARGRELSPYMQSYYPQSSRSRRSFENDYVEDSVPFHDGGMVNNKAGLKSREKFRESFADQETSNTNTNANANEINDSEYFGSLPLSFNGELTRYKRVKRDNPYKS